MGDYYSSIHSVGGVNPIDPDWSRGLEHERQRRRGRDQSGRQWTQEGDDFGLSESFQQKAPPPILPSSAPPRRIVATAPAPKQQELSRSRKRLSQLSLKQKMGQLLFVVADEGVDDDALEKLVRDHEVGGVIFSGMWGSVAAHCHRVNRLQRASVTPMLLGAVWGDGSSFDELLHLPYASTVGRVTEPALLQESGRAIGEFYRQLGLHALLLSFTERTPELMAQVGSEFFLSNEGEVVLERGIELMRGMRAAGILPLPQTCMDSDKEEAEEVEDWLVSQLLHRLSHFNYAQIRPFRRMAQRGVDPMLLPHMFLPILASHRDEPERHPGVGLAFGHLLRQPGDWHQRVLITGEEVGEIVELLMTAVEEGAIAEREIDQKVLAILRAKEQAGLFESGGMVEKVDPELFNSKALDRLHRRIYANALMVRRNDPEALPLRDHCALLEVDPQRDAYFRALVGARCELRFLETTALALEERVEEERLIDQVHEYQRVVVALYQSSSLSPHVVELLHRLRALNKMVIVVAFMPVEKLSGLGREAAIVVAHESEPAAQWAAAMHILEEALPSSE